MMPTAARFIAAIFFAATAYYVTNLAKPAFPEGTQLGLFTPWSMAVSFLCGWKVVGRLIGRGWTSAINTGLYGILVCVFFVTLLFSVNEMVKRSRDFRYDGPMEAVVGIFEIALDYGAYLLDTQILVALLVSGVVTGLVSEAAERKWH